MITLKILGANAFSSSIMVHEISSIENFLYIGTTNKYMNLHFNSKTILDNMKFHLETNRQWEE